MISVYAYIEHHSHSKHSKNRDGWLPSASSSSEEIHAGGLVWGRTCICVVLLAVEAEIRKSSCALKLISIGFLWAGPGFLLWAKDRDEPLL